MDASHLGSFERSDPLLTRYMREVRELGLDYYRIVKDALAVEPRTVADQFGVRSANLAYAITNLDDEQLAILGQTGGLPYEISFTAAMVGAIARPVDRTREFQEGIVEAAAGEKFGRRLVSWRLRELMWRSNQWLLCRELLRADQALGMTIFGLPEEGEGIERLTSGELLGLAIESRGSLRFPDSVPHQLSTVFSDARSLDQIVLTYRMAASTTSICRTARG